MRLLSIKKSCLLILVALFSPNLSASDIAKETRWADQIMDTLMVGETHWLKAGGHKFLGVFTKSTTEKAAGGVIILHGIGVHPNWAAVIQPLRSDLAENGWHTLSIQMPVLKNEAEYKDYIPLFPEVLPRVAAAVAFLKGKGTSNIVVIGHSLGAAMGAHYMAGKADESIRAFVAIGVSGAMEGDPKIMYTHSLKTIHTPVLDLFGSDDLASVLDTVQLRANVAREAGMKNYKQVNVSGANHFFAGKDEELTKVVRGWIRQFAK